METSSLSSSSRSGSWTAGLTMLAPMAWGTTYVTVTQLLPDGRPLLVAAMRVLPAGLVLLVVSAVIKPWRPHGSEWWRTTKLAIFNFGIFFPLLSVAVYRLPGGVASAVGGLQPLFVATLSRPLAGNVPRQRDLVVGSVAAIGVCLVAIHPGADLDPVGLLAAVGARGDPVATHGRCRRRSAVAVGTQSGRLRVPQPHWHGARIRGVVQRHPPASRSCPTTAGVGRAGHRCGAGLGDPRPVADTAPTRRVRHRHRVDRLRGIDGSVRCSRRRAPSAPR